MRVRVALERTVAPDDPPLICRHREGRFAAGDLSPNLPEDDALTAPAEAGAAV